MRKMAELAWRVYYDWVIRRTVHIAVGEEVESVYPSTFILGLYRSGTTLLRYVLDSHSRISCPPESDHLRFLLPLIDNERCRTGLEAMGYDEAHIISKVRDVYNYFMGNYAAAHGKVRWVDKSPSYVTCLDSIPKVFPDGRFIVLYRHAFDVAHSQTKGGTTAATHLAKHRQDGESLLVSAVRYWREYTDRLMAFEAANPDNCICLRYEDLCASPELHINRILEFLGGPWEPGVMDFHRFPHDSGREDNRVRGTRGFSASHGHYRQWSTEIVGECRDIAEPTLSALGYRHLIL
jgi:protein-tyrosine sulfotransferase